MIRKTLIVVATVTLGVALTSISQAQTTAAIVSEDFTGQKTSQPWYFFNGACLPAGTSTDTATQPGTVPSCVTVLSSYYTLQSDKDPALVGGNSGYLGSSSKPTDITKQQADPDGKGALRFTNGYPYGHNQSGAIVSGGDPFPTSQGVQVTFKTLTYRGDKGGNGASGAAHSNDGADGMSFFLMDGSQAAGLGAFGGSLGYSCSNSNDPHDGLVGGYLGLGIDEFGNFLNGSVNTLGVSNPQSLGDNTATGGGQYANRIGLRGAGNIAWSWLNKNYPTKFPSTWTSGKGSQQALAVKYTCANGYLTDYNNKAITVSGAKVTVPDYQALPAAFATLPAGVQIANETAVTRADAVPILYNLKITQDGLLSLSYSYNGGAASNILSNQKISNGTLPASFRFGFAGSTGGASNIHEILCFKATPAESTSTSGAVNVYEDPTLKKGTQLFLAYYYPSDWAGSLTAQTVLYDPSSNILSVSKNINWDARCVLTGVTTKTGKCATGVASMAAEAPTSRVMLTWDGTQGVPFEWGSLSSDEQKALTAGGDATPGLNRVNYLRGDRTNEIDSTGNCPQHTTSSSVPCFRARDSVLGDIVNSSPVTAGPPGQPYTLVDAWKDWVYPTATMPENADDAEKYSDYMTSQQGRENVVYVGANDGFVHGFRAAKQNANGDLDTSDPAMPNDGSEVLAYMPAVVLNSIHPVDSNGNVIAMSDFSNTQYSHAYYVDASPTTGDVFYGSKWHTWVVGGLGAGGAAFYALDVTTPTDSSSSTQFVETNAKNIVIGEWTTTLQCANKDAAPNCGQNMGQTYGSPQIRRFHNGQWGAIFGNGLKSANGASGIYIMLINSSGTPSFYYLTTGLKPSAGVANGITNPSSADYDQDHTIDYIYAGDLLGNVWKFDVTSQDPTQWGVTTSSPLFSAGAAQPITTHITVSTVKVVTGTKNAVGLYLDNGAERVVLAFGTGQQVPQTATSAASYATGQQYLYGIWDWDQGSASTGGWNKITALQPTVGLTTSTTITQSNLQVQTLTRTGSNGTLSKNAVCWNGDSNCGASGTQNKMGWYIALPGSAEQVIFDPFVSDVDGSLLVNTYVPSSSDLLSCTSKASTGFSIGLAAQTGAGLAIPMFSVGGQSYDSVELDAMGAPMVLQSGQAGDNNASYLITHNSQTGATATKLNDTNITSGTRLYWIQKR